MPTLGIIGAGNMAQAMMKRWIACGTVAAGDMLISEMDTKKRAALEQTLGVRSVPTNTALVQQADVLLIAVKPNQCAAVLAEIQGDVGEKPVLSIVTGYTQAMLAEALGASSRALRIMPNTPAMVGEGVFALSRAHALSVDEFAWATALFEAIGRVFIVDEKDFDAIVGVSGSGPAYGFVFIEAMADAGVKCGLPRDMAYQLAAQTLLGAARMVLEGGMHPAALKDAVCSPGGTTIEAIYALEKNGFRAAVMEAVIASTEKAATIRKGMEGAN